MSRKRRRRRQGRSSIVFHDANVRVLKWGEGNGRWGEGNGRWGEPRRNGEGNGAITVR
jgi:hypothetical protein